METRHGETTTLPTPTSSRQSLESQASSHTSNYLSDIEAEAWLKHRLTEEENKKSRTALWTPNSNGVRKPKQVEKAAPRPPVSRQLQGSADNREADNVLETWASGFGKSPQQKSADKARSLGNANLKECWESLSQYLAKCPQNQRAVKEEQEYKLLKGKADQGVTLTSAERNRLKQITKNNERRLFTMSLNKELFNSSEGPVESCDPPNGAPKRATKSATEQAPQEVVSPQIPTPPNAQDEDVVSESTEESDVDMADTDDTEDEESDIEQPQCYWEYSVYRTDTGDVEGCTEPVFMSTYLNKARAEARVREEITNIHKNLADCTRLEVRTVFEDGGFQGQTLEFTSGQIVDLRIVKELIEDQPMVKKTRRSRKKLEFLPIKVYVIFESISEADVQEDESELLGRSSPSPSCEETVDAMKPGIRTITQPIWKECFVVKEHANRQAGRRMMAHQTAHLPDEQKFDVAITGGLDTDSRHHLRELEDGDRLYNRTMALPQVGADGKKREVTVRVMELLLRGPRN